MSVFTWGVYSFAFSIFPTILFIYMLCIHILYKYILNFYVYADTATYTIPSSTVFSIWPSNPTPPPFSNTLLGNPKLWLVLWDFYVATQKVSFCINLCEITNTISLPSLLNAYVFKRDTPVCIEYTLKYMWIHTQSNSYDFAFSTVFTAIFTTEDTHRPYSLVEQQFPCLPWAPCIWLQAYLWC